MVGAVAGIAAVATAAAIAVWWPRERAAVVPRDVPVVLETAPTRPIEGRISYALADRYRGRAVARSAAPATAADAISIETLAGLERRGDLHGVAAAYLLLGEPARAIAYLDGAAGVDAAADRALVLVMTGRAADALVALDGVLEAAPRHPQALWNRALALRELGLPRMASAAFAAAAALGEPGWADEARARGQAIADDTDERAARAGRVIAAGAQLATAPDGVPAELARQVPGMTRLYLYDAVRGATSAAAVRALLPLARTLDEVAGGSVLTAYVERTARADFTRRGPLAARYARITAGERPEPAAAQALLAALRSARQDDILLGALIYTSPDRRTVPPAQLPEYRRLSQASGDLWFELLAAEQDAGALIERREPEAAEAVLLAALPRCRTSRLDYRCLRLERALAQSYLWMLRLSDARRVISEGRARAREAGEWFLEQGFLQQTADLEQLADDVQATSMPLARAYLGEVVHRDPRCEIQAWSHEMVSMMLVNRNQLDRARDELARATEAARTCPEATPTLRTVFLAAFIAGDDQVAAVRAQIAELRAAPTTPPVGRAVLDQAEGRLLIERDRAAGTALLERAITSVRAVARTDVEAHKVRSYAYAVLVLDAGRAGEWQRVWQLLSEEAGVSIERCGLGVALETRRSVVVVRDGSGALAGAYDAARTGTDVDAAHLVPVALRDRLRGCPEIEVIARPPVEGSPALLPGELAWSYRSGAGVARPGSASRSRLVISNTEPPAELGLPRLLPWRSAVAPDVALDGPAATPARALAELADAGFVEIHAHGTVNPAVSDAAFLMLSPDPAGRYALTAAAIRKQPLRGQPIVILAACHAGVTASYSHEPWGLPAAFVEAGARAVIASPGVINDADAGALFDGFRIRIERGASPAIALHDARIEWLAAHPEAAWVRSLMVFR